MENSCYRCACWIICWLRRNLRVGQYFPMLNIRPLTYVRTYTTLCVSSRVSSDVCPHRRRRRRAVQERSATVAKHTSFLLLRARKVHRIARWEEEVILHKLREEQENPREDFPRIPFFSRRIDETRKTPPGGTDSIGKWEGPLASASYTHRHRSRWESPSDETWRNLGRRIIIERTAGCDSLVANGWYTQRRAAANGEELFK